MKTFLLLHVAVATLAALGVLPTDGPPFWLAMLFPFSGAFAAAHFGARRAAGLFAATYVITFVAETWGQTVGLFGAHYAYVPAAWAPLPASLLPFLVPCMWFMMMVPSYALARLVAGQRLVATALLGGLIMTAWDVALDATSVRAGLWAWSSGTPSLFGIPFENYLSWFMGSSIVCGIYAAADRRPTMALSPVAAYAAVALVYLGTADADIRLATLATMGAAVALALVAHVRRMAARRSDLTASTEWTSPPDAEGVKRLRREDFLRHPVKNHFVNSLHIVVAHGEKYMIGNIRRVRDRLGAPHLRRQADWFVEQEGHHAAEHRRFVAQLGKLGYRTGRLDRVCRFIGQTLLPRLCGPALNMAITVAIEHWTATVAEIVLEDRLLADLDPAARRLVEWHCYEELEHRAVAFDVYQDVSGSYALRLVGMAIGIQLIALLSLYGLVSFLAQDRQLLSLSAWREGLGFFYTRQALVLRTLPRALTLARPGFHPSDGFSMEMVRA